MKKWNPTTGLGEEDPNPNPNPFPYLVAMATRKITIASNF